MMGQGRDGGRLRHSAKKVCATARHEAGETGIAFFACWGSTEGGKGLTTAAIGVGKRRGLTDHMRQVVSQGEKRNQAKAAMRSRRLYEGDAQDRIGRFAGSSFEDKVRRRKTCA